VTYHWQRRRHPPWIDFKRSPRGRNSAADSGAFPSCVPGPPQVREPYHNDILVASIRVVATTESGIKGSATVSKCPTTVPKTFPPDLAADHSPALVLFPIFQRHCTALHCFRRPWQGFDDSLVDTRLPQNKNRGASA
jgi:hypothetical protein